MGFTLLPDKAKTIHGTSKVLRRIESEEGRQTPHVFSTNTVELREPLLDDAEFNTY